MRYFKQIENGYILAIGTGGGGVAITEVEYNEIMAVIQSKPPRTETADFRLKVDLTWEEYEVPPEPEEDIDDSETVNILLGRENEAEQD